MAASKHVRKIIFNDYIRSRILKAYLEQVRTFRQVEESVPGAHGFMAAPSVWFAAIRVNGMSLVISRESVNWFENVILGPNSDKQLVDRNIRLNFEARRM